MRSMNRAALAIAGLGALGALVPAVAAVGAEGNPPGAQVSGQVTDAESGAPAPGVEVCVEAVAPEEGEVCDATDAEGNYAIVGIPAGTYLVAFGVEPLPGGGRTAAQWWDGASSADEATPLTMAPPQIFTGIDGQLGAGATTPPQAGGGTIVVPAPQTPPPPELQPLRCKKGYRWRKVDGVKRCVRKPHHHRRHHRTAG